MQVFKTLIFVLAPSVENCNPQNTNLISLLKKPYSNSLNKGIRVGSEV